MRQDIKKIGNEKENDEREGREGKCTTHASQQEGS